MFGDLISLLTVGELTLSAVLLAGIVYGGVGLWKEWFVTGPRWRAKLEDCKGLSEANEKAGAELAASREAFHKLEIELAVIKEAHRIERFLGLKGMHDD